MDKKPLRFGPNPDERPAEPEWAMPELEDPPIEPFFTGAAVMADPALIEAIARALFAGNPTRNMALEWDDAATPRGRYRRHAANTLAALHKMVREGVRGIKYPVLILSSKPPTDETYEAVDAVVAGIYRAMLAATGAAPTVADLEFARRRLGELNECAPISDCQDCERGLTTSCRRRAEAVLGEK